MQSGPLAFEKFEGAGNDFILVRADELADVPAALAMRMCDRHFGIGADGVLLVLPSRVPDCAARMHVINADGSVPEMCGNGLRCVALALSAAPYQSASVRVDTDAGARACLVEREDRAAQVTVEMGAVRLDGERRIQVGDEEVVVYVADTGNPHAVVWGVASSDRIATLGPAIAKHPSFPQGINVEFASVANGAIDLVVWERGVGLTLACGTGACATAAVAWSQGRLPHGSTRVRLPGGDLTISPGNAGGVLMRGGARRVFRGTYIP